MFRELHFRLSALLTSILILLMGLLSALFLYAWENSIWKNSFASFEADMNTLLSHLQEQTVISHHWLKQMEQNHYHIYLSEDGSPFYYNQIASGQAEKALAAQFFTWYDSQYPNRTAVWPLAAFHREFSFQIQKGGQAVPASRLSQSDYFVSCADIPRKQSTLFFTAFYTTEPIQAQIARYRLFTVILNLAGALILFWFSYFFTGRLLSPIRENQEQQAHFIASASHELRTPLAVIQAALDACAVAPPAEKDLFLADIREESQRMKRLIDDLLFLAREDAAAGTADPPMEAVSPDTLLLDLYEHFSLLAQKKEQHLSIHLPEEEIPLCTCHPDRLYQLLSILLQNALSYTETGGSITLSLALAGHGLLFSVADTGPGIPDSEKKRIFRRFYRSQSSRSSREHFGLGLAIASEIARAHHAVLSVSDNPGGGSRFTLLLPPPAASRRPRRRHKMRIASCTLARFPRKSKALLQKQRRRLP